MLIEHLVDVGGAERRRVASAWGTSTSSTPRPVGSSTATRPSPSAAGGGWCSSRRRPRDAAALADLRGGAHAPLRRGLRHARRPPDRRRHRGRELLQPAAARVVVELDAEGLLVEDDGALCVFPEGFTNREGEPLPLIVRKSDGGYGYAATDLACVRDRTGPASGPPGSSTWSAPRRPSTCGWSSPWPPWPAGCPTARRPCTSAFGLVLGTDRKKLASRSGGSERLVDLLDEAIDRAAAAMKERSSDLSPERQAAVAPRARHRRGQVRRPVDRADAGLRLRLGPDAGLRGQHRPVPAVRPRPHPLHLPAGRGGAAADGRRRSCSASPRSARWPCSCCGFAEAVEATVETLEPGQALRLPLRPGDHLHHVLRGLPGPGRRRGRADVAPRAVRPHGPGARAGAVAARHRGARPDVTGTRDGPYPLAGTPGAGPAVGRHHEGGSKNDGTERDIGNRHRWGVRLGEATSRLLSERGVRVVVADLQEDKGRRWPRRSAGCSSRPT